MHAGIPIAFQQPCLPAGMKREWHALSDGCSRCSLQSALHAFGDDVAVRLLVDNAAVIQGNVNRVRELYFFFQQARGLKYDCTYGAGRMDVDSLLCHAISQPSTFYVVNLVGTDGSTNHSVTLFAGLIFDAAVSHACVLTLENLDRCTGAGCKCANLV